MAASQITQATPGSNGAIVLSPNGFTGDFLQESFFQNLGAAQRRVNRYGANAAVTPVDLTELQDTTVKVAGGFGPIRYEPSQMTWLQRPTAQGVEVASRAFAEVLLKDQLNTAIAALVAAITAQAAAVNDVSATLGISQSGLNSAHAKFGDASQNLVAQVMQGTTWHKLVGQAEYAQKRDGLIGNERDEVTAAYEAEIAALEAVQNKSSTTAAQRIQLDQKIADARAAMVKAQKDADSQQEVLATAETGRLDKQKYAIKQYVAALGQQQKALELAGQRAVNGVGQGNRQNALNGELNSQQDRFAQQSLDLANQQSDPSRKMDPDEFEKKSRALADANKKATDQIRQNYADVEAAQGDWTKGATSAWANYLDSARDIAGQTRNLFTNAFSSMEDSIVNFAMTGKASFGDFAKSILADMARIATRQASSALLGTNSRSLMG